MEQQKGRQGGEALQSSALMKKEGDVVGRVEQKLEDNGDGKILESWGTPKIRETEKKLCSWKRWTSPVRKFKNWLSDVKKMEKQEQPSTYDALLEAMKASPFNWEPEVLKQVQCAIGSLKQLEKILAAYSEAQEKMIHRECTTPEKRQQFIKLHEVFGIFPEKKRTAPFPGRGSHQERWNAAPSTEAGKMLATMCQIVSEMVLEQIEESVDVGSLQHLEDATVTAGAGLDRSEFQELVRLQRQFGELFKDFSEETEVQGVFKEEWRKARTQWNDKEVWKSEMYRVLHGMVFSKFLKGADQGDRAELAKGLGKYLADRLGDRSCNLSDSHEWYLGLNDLARKKLMTYLGRGDVDKRILEKWTKWEVANKALAVDGKDFLRQVKYELFDNRRGIAGLVRESARSKLSPSHNDVTPQLEAIAKRMRKGGSQEDIQTETVKLKSLLEEIEQWEKHYADFESFIGTDSCVAYLVRASPGCLPRLRSFWLKPETPTKQELLAWYETLGPHDPEWEKLSQMFELTQTFLAFSPRIQGALQQNLAAADDNEALQGVIQAATALQTIENLVANGPSGKKALDGLKADITTPGSAPPPVMTSQEFDVALAAAKKAHKTEKAEEEVRRKGNLQKHARDRRGNQGGPIVVVGDNRASGSRAFEWGPCIQL